MRVAGCLSPRAALALAAAALRPWLPRWFAAATGPKLTVLVAPHQGLAGLHLSVGATPAQPEMQLAVQMFDSDACIWTRHFIEEAPDTALHEWFHFASFMQRGPAADRLREEFVAHLNADSEPAAPDLAPDSTWTILNCKAPLVLQPSCAMPDRHGVRVV